MSVPTLEWIRQNASFNTTNVETLDTYNYNRNRISVDRDGNIYMSYTTFGTVPGGDTNVTGDPDIIVMKMSPSGSVLWIKQSYAFNSTTPGKYSVSPTIALGNSGYLYISFFYFGDISGGDTANRDSIAVMKMRCSDGEVIWMHAKNIDNPSSFVRGPSIGVDAVDNCYIVYYGVGNISGQTSSGSYDIIIFKLDSNGTTQWNKQLASINTSNGDMFPSIAVDSTGNSIIAYRVQNINISGGTNVGGFDIVIATLDNNGNLLWAKQNNSFDTSGNDSDPSVVIDTLGNIYVAYSTNGVVSGQSNSGFDDIAVLKMDSSGNTIWVRQNNIFNTSTLDRFPSIAVDNNNNIYISYQTSGEISGGTSSGSNDIVLVKISSNGDIIWTYQQPTINTDVLDAIPNIAVDANKNIYVVYQTYGDTSGNTNTGSIDIVIFKMSQPGENTFALRVNPYRAIGNVKVYTTETIDALVKGDPLPATKEVSWSPATAGQLLKPLDRFKVALGINGLHTHRFAEVQLIGGVATEGVGGAAPNWNCGWICVWAADGVAPIL
jgi:hypothetical protein